MRLCHLRLGCSFRLLLSQACRRLTERMDFAGGRGRGVGKHPLLLILDEFPALGKLAFFQESLAYLAGYGIRAMLITQDLSQHQGVYGRQESITANCHVRIAFAANKPETAELMSQMAGDTTVSHKQVSYRGGEFDLMMDHRHITQQEVRRRLLTPDEAMRLDGDHEVVFVAGEQPIYAEKLRYFEDLEFERKASVAAPLYSSRPCAWQWSHKAPTPSARAIAGDTAGSPAEVQDLTRFTNGICRDQGLVGRDRSRP